MHKTNAFMGFLFESVHALVLNRACAVIITVSKQQI